VNARTADATRSDLRGRTALVTGGGTGLGRAVALRLAAAGAAVAVNYSRSSEEARATAGEIETAGGRAIAVQADVSDSDAVSAMMREVAQALGPVEVLIANAGITQYVPFSDLEALTVDLWERILRVNVIGSALCIQTAAPQMVERGFGRIVVISSNSAFCAAGSSIPYVVSKGALVTLTECLARSLAPAVQVNAVAPGWMLTPWIGKYLPGSLAEALASGELEAVAVDDVARLVVDIASNGSLTGQAIVIDRGETLLTRG
jgi:3-oxoacyl-[acyl-carrier protein] reductase